MRKSRPIPSGVVPVLALTLWSAVSFAATITGTAHDLSRNGYGMGDVCASCHTERKTRSTEPIPMWNHTSKATYTLYTSSTMDAAPRQPGGVSKACLSCHDGTVAADSCGGNTGMRMIMGSSDLGTDLGDDHPVSLTYDMALAATDSGLVKPSSSNWVDNGHTLPLYNGKLECGSCHNVHDNSHGSFLRKSNSGSALCLTCHIK